MNWYNNNLTYQIFQMLLKSESDPQAILDVSKLQLSGNLDELNSRINDAVAMLQQRTGKVDLTPNQGELINYLRSTIQEGIIKDEFNSAMSNQQIPNTISTETGISSN